MADFDIAYTITMGNEGGFNHGVGENPTFFGIDEGMNPNWAGWPLVHSIIAANPGRTDAQLNVIFRMHGDLMALKDNFYKRSYWNNLLLDQINDQQVANNLFDCSVNPCIDPAAKVLQKACNVVKPECVVVDGEVGKMTIAVANALAPELLITAINGIRSANYHHEVVLRPAKGVWLPDWLKRLVPYKR
jgi:hypothetical protein